MNFIFEVPKKYNSKILETQTWIKQRNPVFYINNLCNFKGLNKVYIEHKPLKLAAEFRLPDKILLDFRNSVKYIVLCIAHEYSHLLLRANIPLDYSIEQSLAILLQLSYENSAGIRKFNYDTAKELMNIMNVWPNGQPLLKKWLSYWNPKKGKTNQYHNILDFIKKVL